MTIAPFEKEQKKNKICSRICLFCVYSRNCLFIFFSFFYCHPIYKELLNYFILVGTLMNSPRQLLSSFTCTVCTAAQFECKWTNKLNQEKKKEKESSYDVDDDDNDNAKNICKSC